MNIDPETMEALDSAILKVLDTNRTRFGLSVVALSHHLAGFGFLPGQFGGAEAFHNILLDRLDYLGGKQLVEEVAKVTHKENRAWRITTKGMQYVDERG